MPRAQHRLAAVALVMLLAGTMAASAPLCLLKLSVVPAQSHWGGSGNTTVPFTAVVTSTKLNATGTVYLEVPTDSCPPKALTAEDAVGLIEQSSLLLPTGSKSSITFKPSDLKSNVTTDPKEEPVAKFDFLGLSFGLTGNEPLAPGAVVLGNGTAEEAKAAAGGLCAQLVLLNGTLDLTSLLGPRTSDVRHVAYNRSMAAGASIKQVGDGVGNLTLFVRNASLFLNVSPEAMPGVELSRATYLLSGDVVATADLASAKSWEELPEDEADWAGVRRLDAPVIIGGDKPRKPRYIGLNDTIPQACKPTRARGGAAAAQGDAAAPAGGAAAPAGGKSGAGAAAAARWGPAAAAAAAALAALLAL